MTICKHYLMEQKTNWHPEHPWANLDHEVPKDHLRNCMPKYLESGFSQFSLDPRKRKISLQLYKHKKNEMICLIHLIEVEFQSIRQCNFPHLVHEEIPGH